MDLNIREGRIPIGQSYMEYNAFGNGENSIVMIPGMADGLWPSGGHSKDFAELYSGFANHFTVYLFSRKNEMPYGYSTDDMMEDIVHAMDYFHINRAHVLGHSQGAMIASLLAAKHPDRVNRLCLIVPLARQNDVFRHFIQKLLDLAIANRAEELVCNLMENYYTEITIQSFGGVDKIAQMYGEPSKPLTRFVRCAEALLTFSSYDLLPSIQAPTLVLAGEKDQIVTFQGSKEVAERIPGAQFVSFKEYGHAVNEEMKDFPPLLYSFFI